MARIPNQRLRAARLARAMTQDQVAEAANEHVRIATGTPGAMDSSYLSKLERGVHTWPTRAYRQALALVLGVQGERELGFYSPRSADDLCGAGGLGLIGGGDDVDRLAFLHVMAGVTVGAVVGGAAVEEVARAASGGVPATVGLAEVHQVRHTTEVFGAWADQYGGGYGRAARRGQLAWARSLLGARGSDEVMVELHREVGYLADSVGWAGFDAGHHDDARVCFTMALACAERAGDWGLRANVVSDLARQALFLGRTDDALSLIEMAQVRADRLTATTRSMLGCVHAQILAALGRPRDALRAVGVAEEEFARSRPQVDPGWIRYFDEPHLHGDAGRALLAVALHDGQAAVARDRLWQAVSGYPTGHERSRALAVGELAVLELRVGDPQAGLLYAQRALSAGVSMQSARSSANLRLLDDALRATPGADARELREEIRRGSPV